MHTNHSHEAWYLPVYGDVYFPTHCSNVSDGLCTDMLVDLTDAASDTSSSAAG